MISRKHYVRASFGLLLAGLLLSATGSFLYRENTMGLPWGFTLITMAIFFCTAGGCLCFGYVMGRDVQAQKGGHGTFPNPGATL